MGIADQDIFKYKFDIPKSVRPFMQKSSSEDNGSITLSYRVSRLDAIYYFILPYF